MIDIRYVERFIPAPDMGKDVGIKTRELQVRYMQNPEEIGIQPPIWGEWEDIRVEEDKDS